MTTSVERPKRGDLYVVLGERRPAERLFVEVRRVARDGSWADCACYTWAVAWTKRLPLPLPDARRRDWTAGDIDEQLADWEARRRED